MKDPISNTLFFYQGQHLVSLKQGNSSQSIFRNADTPLAEVPLVELHSGGASLKRLLATDLKTSVLYGHDRQESHTYTYAPYGHSIDETDPQLLIAFNGQRRDSFMEFYMLGNGHRSFSPALNRFLTTDSLSPFGTGGINAYSYCGNDPTNRADPTGQSWMSPFKGIANLFGRTRSRDRTSTNPMRHAVSDPNVRHRGIEEGRLPPTYEQSMSEDLNLPTYQFVEDHMPVAVRRRLQDLRKKQGIVASDIRTMIREFGEAPPSMTYELHNLRNLSVRLRIRAHIDLRNATLSPNHSTAIVDSAPPRQNQNVQRIRRS